MDKRRHIQTSPWLKALELSESIDEAPPRYRVFILQDDYTPIAYIIDMLQNFFNISREQASQLSQDIHEIGIAVCGIYTREIAETYVSWVNEYSRQSAHPLLCGMEEI